MLAVLDDCVQSLGQESVSFARPAVHVESCSVDVPICPLVTERVDLQVAQDNFLVRDAVVEHPSICNKRKHEGSDLVQTPSSDAVSASQFVVSVAPTVLTMLSGSRLRKRPLSDSLQSQFSVLSYLHSLHMKDEVHLAASAFPVNAKCYSSKPLSLIHISEPTRRS